jgi:murein DD-endopeptidase MepM/ murein hydrolase activator NlpD
MRSNRNIVYFFRNFSRKHRLSLRKQHDGTEVWYMHTSPLEFLGGAVATVLILFILVLLLVASTPVLNLIPGYHGNESREMTIESIMKVDSIERRLNEIQLYTSDVSRIIEGKTPVTIVQPAADSVAGRNETVLPNAADSALRAQMEGSGAYGLDQQSPAARPGMDLSSPVKGVVATHFDPKEGRYGTGISTAAREQVMAVEDGTITLSMWSPEGGYTIQIQHFDNLISIYKNCSRAVQTVGARVRGGEVIGYTSEEDGKGLFEVELWRDGTPVDPESFILF